MHWFLLAGSIEALLFQLRVWGDLREHLRETIFLQLTLGLLYLLAVYAASLVRESKIRHVRFIIIAAVLFRVTVWPLVPALSDDLFRYRWEAAVQHSGGNPYFSRPADPEWSHLRDRTYNRIPGVDFRAVYGPLTELILRATYPVVSKFESDPERQAFWFKAPFALCDLLALFGALFLLRSAALPMEHVVIYAWCPLPVLEFWGSGHNDSLCIALLIAAIAFARLRRWPVAMILLGLSAGAKLWPLALVPLFCRHGRWRDVWIAPAVLGALALPYWPSDTQQLILNLRFASGFVGGWRNNDSLFGVLLWLADGDFYIAKRLAFATAGTVLVILTAIGGGLERAILWFVASLLFVSANCHPWYLSWLLPALLVQPALPLLLWIVLSPLAYISVFLWYRAGQWIGIHSTRWYIYLPVYGLVLSNVILKWCSPKQRHSMKPR